MKKRILSILLCCVMLLGLLPTAVFAEGTPAGTESDPILISSVQELKDFAQRVNNGETTLCAKLTADIVLNDGTFNEDGSYTKGTSGMDAEAWTPIGYLNNDSDYSQYAGTFDGGGYSIKGLYVTGAKQAGLFGYAGSATIKNVTVDGYVAGTDYVGGIVGQNVDGKILNCANLGTVSASASNDSVSDIGGIVGYASGTTVTDCYNVGKVMSHGDMSTHRVGGIVGDASQTTITTCYNAGEVSKESGNSLCYVGGIAGYQWKGTISYCCWLYSIGTNYDAVGKNDGGANSMVPGLGKTAFVDGTVLKWLRNNRTDSPWEKLGYVAAAGITLPLLKGQEADAHTCTPGVVLGQCDCGLIIADGSTDKPYLIYTVGHLKRFRDEVNTGKYGIHAKLMADIVLNDGKFDEDGNYTPGASGKNAETWRPIGFHNSGHSYLRYVGTFDGGGHSIKGLYVTGAKQAGLFGYVKGATIKNVTVDGYVAGTDYAGGIVGQIFGDGSHIENCVNLCRMASTTANAKVGGIVGFDEEGEILNCANLGTVSVSLEANDSVDIGGIVGYAPDTAVTDCYNAGKVMSLGNRSEGSIGGIAGAIDRNTTITNCYNAGELSKESTSLDCHIGGVAGYQSNNGTISNCYWLYGTANKAVGKNDGGTQTNAEARNKAEFANGDVLELLKNNRTDSPWTKTGYVAAADMVLPMFSWQTADTMNITGTGLAEDPYQIYTAEGLKQFRDKVNGGESGAHAKLMNDIALNDGTFDENGNWSESGTPNKWTPIGTEENKAYSGTFDGDGHTIKGVYVKGESTPIESAGLFGYVKGAAEIRHLTVDGYVEGKTYAAGIAGYACYEGGMVEKQPKISDCTNECIVKAVGDSSDFISTTYAGGIVGWGNGLEIYECRNKGKVSVGGGMIGNYVGGIVGQMGGSAFGGIEFCRNDGGVTASGAKNYAGGIAGADHANDHIFTSLNTGKVTATGDRLNYAGGVVGIAKGITIYDGYNVGAVSASGGEAYVGGVIGGNGYEALELEWCYSTGVLTAGGEDEKLVGGIAGKVDEGVRFAFTKCYWLTGTADKAAGSGSGTKDGVEAKSKYDFANGDVLALFSSGAWESGYLDAAKMTLPLLNLIIHEGDPHDHEFEWKYTEGEHWQECYCGVIVNRGAHDETDDGDCTTAVVCVCGATVKAAQTEHDWGAWTSNGNDTHTHKCQSADCTASETEHCSGGTATCTDKATCSDCGAEYGALKAHSFTAENTDAKYLKTAATCTDSAVYYKSCAVCGEKGTETFTFGSPNGHDWGAWTSNGNDTHTHNCQSAGCTASETEHCSGGTATCTDKATCSGCGAEYGALKVHSFTAEDTDAKYLKTAATCTDSAVYYKSCAVCGEKGTETFTFGSPNGHDWGAWTSNGNDTHTHNCQSAGCTASETEHCSGGTATCTDKAKCTICNEEYGNTNPDNHTDTTEWIQTETKHTQKYKCCGAVTVPEEDHKWENGVCTECGYECLHTGGTANCTEKAVCEVCGKSYGELNASNHADLKHIEATAATKTAEGNTEYWHCEGCGKYFADKDGNKEITKADTVTAKLPEEKPTSPATGDTSNLTLWIALLFISGGVVATTTIVGEKKRHSKE